MGNALHGAGHLGRAQKKLEFCKAGVLFGQDREGVISFDSQMGLNVRVQSSYFQGWSGNCGTE